MHYSTFVILNTRMNPNLDLIFFNLVPYISHIPHAFPPSPLGGCVFRQEKLSWYRILVGSLSEAAASRKFLVPHFLDTLCTQEALLCQSAVTLEKNLAPPLLPPPAFQKGVVFLGGMLHRRKYSIS